MESFKRSRMQLFMNPWPPDTREWRLHGTSRDFSRRSKLFGNDSAFSVQKCERHDQVLRALCPHAAQTQTF